MKKTCLFAVLLAFRTSLPLFAGGNDFVQTGSVYENHFANGDLNYRYSTTNAYDSRGRLFQITYDYYFPGIPGFYPASENFSTYTYIYDKHGAVVSNINEIDTNGDGIIDQRSTTSYTQLSRTQSRAITLTDLGNDGTIDQIEIQTFTDTKNTVTTISDFDTNADGAIDSRVFDSWTYDSQQHPVYYLHTEDYNLDGKPDATIQVTNTFDPGGRQTASMLIFDSDGDGVADETRTTTYIYDERGRLLQSDVTDSNLNPIFDSSSQTIYTYDKFGNLFQETTQNFGGDGQPGGIDTTTYFYARLKDVRKEARVP